MINRFENSGEDDIFKNTEYLFLNPFAVNRLAQLLSEKIIENLGSDAEKIDFLISDYYCHGLTIMTAFYLSQKINRNHEIMVLTQDLGDHSENFHLSDLSERLLRTQIYPEIVIIESLLTDNIKGLISYIKEMYDLKLVMAVSNAFNKTAKDIGFEKFDYLTV